MQTLAVAKLLAGEAGLCRAAVHQCPSGNCQQSMLLAAQSISHYSGPPQVFFLLRRFW